jgi:hypothetical protein
VQRKNGKIITLQLVVTQRTAFRRPVAVMRHLFQVSLAVIIVVFQR